MRLRFLLDNLFAFVEATVRAYSVREFQLAALCALRETRHGKFPYVGTSFVASCFGRFSLRYRHDQHLLQLSCRFTAKPIVKAP